MLAIVSTSRARKRPRHRMPEPHGGRHGRGHRCRRGRPPTAWRIQRTGRPMRLRCEQDQHLLVVVVDLHAEAAADIRRDHADLLFGDIEGARRKHDPDWVGVLVGRVERVFVAPALIDADCAPRLDRAALTRFWTRSSVTTCAGGCENRPNRAGVAQRPVEAEVRRKPGMNPGSGRIKARRQVRVTRPDNVVDLDQLGG